MFHPVCVDDGYDFGIDVSVGDCIAISDLDALGFCNPDALCKQHG